MLARSTSEHGTQIVRDRLLGQVLHGARLESVIGEGSAARVYRAKHVVLEREYAVKVLSIPHAQKQELVTRFYREARALAQLGHENIVSIIDSGETTDGRPFLTMELLYGETLQERLDRRRLGFREIVRLARQMLRGLGEAHRRGLVHRDLKPANVMLVGATGEETVKLLDFGIVRLKDRMSTNLTGGEMILGTPRYMAPEQVMNAASASARSDLYSFGVMLYEMLSGRAPFEGALLEVLDKQFNAEPPRLRTTCGLEPLVYALLSKEPENRPKTAEAVLDALDAIEGRREELSFDDQTGVVYVERTAKESMPFGATVNESNTSEVLPPMELNGPTLMDVPFDENEETMPSGIEPTVRRLRPASSASTNLRVVDEERAYDVMATAPPTELDLGSRDTDPDPEPPSMMTKLVESPMTSSGPIIAVTDPAAHPALIVTIALLLAFCATMAVGIVCQSVPGL